MGYLTNFLVYAFAMVGVIMLALMVFKITSTGRVKGNAKYLNVVDTLSLAPRKTLYIVSAGEERFLIAGDVDRTTLISKLGQKENEGIKDSIPQTFKQTMESLPQKTSYMDKSNIGIYSTQNKPYDSALKNLAARIRG